MADPFVAEVRIYPFAFAPRGWAKCEGQLLPLTQNTALFALLGTNFGGDGKNNFALPNLMGSAPMCAGNGQNLSPRTIGETGGAPSVILETKEIPAHSHQVVVSLADATEPGPSTQQFATGKGINSFSAPGNVVQMSPLALTFAGNTNAHNNMMPYLTLNFCIALQGVFPPHG